MIRCTGFLIFFLFFVCHSPIFAFNLGPPPVNSKLPMPSYVQDIFSSLPLTFEPNMGQADPRVIYLSRNKGYVLFLTESEAIISFNANGPKIPIRSIELLNPLAQDKPYIPNESTKGANLSLKWKTGVGKVKAVGSNKLQGKSNYFIGKGREDWIQGVEHFGKATLQGIGPGIDLAFYGLDGVLEFDWILHPHAQPDYLTLELDGMKNIKLELNGDLRIEMSSGELFTLKAPIAYQIENGRREIIGSKYELTGHNLIQLSLAAYDKRRILVVDPVLLYSTYFGGNGYEFAHGVAVDGGGNAYVTGWTNSTNFPLAGALQPFKGGVTDAFVFKLDPTGTSLIYATYLGGAGDDLGNGIAVDVSGCAYVIGQTSSTDFPTQGAQQSVIGGIEDAFVTKLNPSGGTLAYSTYLGGSRVDYGFDIAVDGSGSAAVVGETFSLDFPLQSQIQSSCSGGCPGSFSDAFVSRFSASGASLQYSTYLGGTRDDSAFGVAFDVGGNVLVSGGTDSNNFPLVNPFQASLGGSYDAFVSKIVPTGTSLVFSTYLGGGSADIGKSIAVDSGGNACVSGYTNSTNFPILNAFQPVKNGPQDIFVSKLNIGGSALLFSTYLGGSDQDMGDGIDLDNNDNLYLTGRTSSTDFPLVSPIQSACGGGCAPGTFDTFIVKMSSTGGTLDYSTYLGGVGYDHGYSIAVDSVGNAYVVGETRSTDFPLVNAFQTTLSDALGDAFVAKISAFAPSPTETSTVTQSFTVSPTWSLTHTRSPSRTMTSTFSHSPTDTATRTTTPSRTTTATSTPTPTASHTSTISPTLTPSPSNTRSPTFTPSSTVSPTFTACPTITPSCSYTNSPTITSTPSSNPSDPKDFFEQPDLILIRAIYPNPAFDLVNIYFTLRLKAEVLFNVYNVAGEAIFTHRQYAAAGVNIFKWLGVNDSGGRIASGIYLIQLTAFAEDLSSRQIWETVAIAR